MFPKRTSPLRPLPQPGHDGPLAARVSIEPQAANRRAKHLGSGVNFAVSCLASLETEMGVKSLLVCFPGFGFPGNGNGYVSFAICCCPPKSRFCQLTPQGLGPESCACPVGFPLNQPMQMALSTKTHHPPLSKTAWIIQG